MYNGKLVKTARHHHKAIDLLETQRPDSPTLLLAYLNVSENLVQLDSLHQP